MSYYKSVIMYLLLIIVFGFLTNNINGDIEPQDSKYSDVTESILNNNDKPQDTSSIENNNNNNNMFGSNVGFIHGFIASFSVIIVSELGDKTFFIAAIMAMRHPRLTVFTGAIAALALMTVLSVVFGMAATIVPRVYTYYISTALFAIFGLKMLKEGYYMSPNEGQEELEEVQLDIRKREDELLKTLNTDDAGLLKKDETNDKCDDDVVHDNTTTINDSTIITTIASITTLPTTATTLSSSSSTTSIKTINNNNFSSSINNIDENIDTIEPSTSTNLMNSSRQRRFSKDNTITNGDINTKRLEKEASTVLITQDPESGTVRKTKRNVAWYLASRVLMQSFTMTFLAEWGDRSQLTTIILGARENVYGVIVGGIIGHSICTGIAVLGGRMIAQKISVRTVTLVGGVVFLIFAISALFISPEEDAPATSAGPN